MRTAVLMAELLILAAILGACTGGATPTASAPSATVTTKTAGPDPTTTPSLGSESVSISVSSESEVPPVRKYPSIQPSSTVVSGSRVTIEYGQVPEDFVPEIPDL